MWKAGIVLRLCDSDTEKEREGGQGSLVLSRGISDAQKLLTLLLFSKEVRRDLNGQVKELKIELDRAAASLRIAEGSVRELQQERELLERNVGDKNLALKEAEGLLGQFRQGLERVEGEKQEVSTHR